MKIINFFILSSILGSISYAESAGDRISQCSYNIHQSSIAEEMRVMNSMIHSSQAEIEQAWARLLDNKISRVKKCYNLENIDEVVAATGYWKGSMAEQEREFENSKAQLERMKEVFTKGEELTEQITKMHDDQTRLAKSHDDLVSQWYRTYNFMERNRLQMEINRLAFQVGNLRYQIKQFYFNNRFYIDNFKSMQGNLNNLNGQIFRFKYYGDNAKTIHKELKDKLYELRIRNPNSSSIIDSGINNTNDIRDAGDRINSNVSEYRDRVNDLQDRLNQNTQNLRDLQSLANDLNTW